MIWQRDHQIFLCTALSIERRLHYGNNAGDTPSSGVLRYRRMAKARTTTRTKRTETLQRGIYRYTAIFEPAQEGGYVVTVPALNGLTTEGETLEEARTMAADAIRCYLESLQKHGEEIPVESDAPIMRRIAVNLSRA